MIDGIFSQNISVFLVKTNIVFTKTKNVNNSLYFLQKTSVKYLGNSDHHRGVISNIRG